MAQTRMFGPVLGSLLSHWRRKPAQALMLALGLAVATALWSGVQAVNGQARAAYDQAARTLGGDQLARLQSDIGAPLPIGAYLELRRAGYAVSPVIEAELRDGRGRLRLIGIDPLTAPPQTAAPNPSAGFDFAGFLTAPGVLLMSEDTANGPLPDGLPPRQISDNIPGGAAITDISTAARLSGQADPSYLIVAPEQPFGLPPIEAATDLVLVHPQSRAEIGQLTDSFHLNLTAFGLLSFVIGLFIANAAIGLAFEQRRSLVRTLRALGAPMRRILLALGLELSLIALIAGSLGLVIGYALAALLMPGVAGSLRGLYGADVAGELQFRPLWAVSGLLMTLAGTGVAALQAMIKTAKMPLLRPAMPRAWAVAQGRTDKVQAALGLALLLGSLGLYAFGQSLVASFACLGCLLVGAALFLPWVLRRVLGALRPRGALWQWVFADTRQQLPALSMALMALLLALVANIGVSTMVGSFRATFLGWLDQRLAAELYVTGQDPDRTQALIDALIPEVGAILPITRTEIRLGNQPVEVFGIVDHATYRTAWPLLMTSDRPWQQLYEGNSALINEQFSYRLDARPGDTLNLTPDLSLEIVGIYADYGNPNAQVIVPLDMFQTHFPDVGPSGFAIRAPPNTVPALASRLREEFGLPTQAVTNQAQVKAFSVAVFEQTFLVTAALNVLTLAVAALALLTNLLSLSEMRLPQLAPLWAIGVSRRKLAALELARTIVLSLLTFALALPVGLALAWVLLSFVNVEAFGWRLPMILFPFDWVRLLFWALIAAGLASLIPALRLATGSPTRLVHVFTQER